MQENLKIIQGIMDLITLITLISKSATMPVIIRAQEVENRTLGTEEINLLMNS